MKYTIYFLLSLFLFVNPIDLFSQFDVSGQFRTRAELGNGYKSLPTETNDPGFFISQRTRLNFNYSFEKIKTRFSIYDVRVWGDEDVYNKSGFWAKDSSSLDIYEAWVEFKIFKNSRIRIGKQELKYDDQRLISWRNWSQYGLSYDALLYSFKNKNLQADVVLSFNNKSANSIRKEYYTNNNRMKTMNFVYIKKKFTKNMQLSLIGLANGYEKEGNASIIYLTETMGGNFTYKNKLVNATATAYYQMGENATGQEVNAFLIAGKVFGNYNNFTFGGGFDLYSGHDAKNTDEDYIKIDHTFDNFFGARFSVNGNMNQITLIDVHTKNGGLTDLYGRIQYAINKKSTVRADLHILSLTNDVLNTVSGEYYDKALSKEIDLLFIHKFNKTVKLNLGFCYSLPSETFENFKGVYVENQDAINPYWSYLMLTVNPTFFTSK